MILRKVLAPACLAVIASLSSLAAESTNSTEYRQLLAAPWKDSEELRFELKFANGYRAGVAFYEIESGDSGRTWQTTSRVFAAVHSYSRVQADAGSMRPIHSRWKHQLIGEVEADYSATNAVLKSRGKDDKRIPLNEPVYDNEELIQLIRRLPLADGYTATLPVLSTLANGKIVPVTIRVSGTESVIVPAGKVDAYKVELSVHQTFWYSTDPFRLPVKYQTSSAVAELVEVSVRKGRQAEKFVEPAYGFSLTLPQDWRIYRADNGETKAETVVLLDPEADVESSVTIQNQADLKPELKRSLREWAEAQLKDNARPLRIRTDSWKQRKVSGHDAWSVLADVTDPKQKKVACLVFTFGATNAASFYFAADAGQFERLQPAFEQLLQGYKTN